MNAARLASYGRDRYFLELGGDVRFFFEEEAPDELNKMGPALHDVDPVFDRMSRQPKLAALTHSGLARPVRCEDERDRRPQVEFERACDTAERFDQQRYQLRASSWRRAADVTVFGLPDGETAAGGELLWPEIDNEAQAVWNDLAELGLAATLIQDERT